MFNQLNQFEDGAFYQKIVKNKNLRRAIARFRLGEYLWSSEKFSDGNRKCPLCEQKDDFIHIMLDCKALDHIRNEFIFKHLSVKEILDNRDSNIVNEACRYLLQYFNVRDNNLELRT